MSASWLGRLGEVRGFDQRRRQFARGGRRERAADLAADIGHQKIDATLTVHGHNPGDVGARVCRARIGDDIAAAGRRDARAGERTGDGRLRSVRSVWSGHGRSVAGGTGR